MKEKVANKKLYAGLIASFCIIILFSIILTSIGVVTIKNVRNYYAYTIQTPEMKIRLLKDIKTDFMTMRYRVANYIMNSGDADYIYETAYRQYESAQATLHNNLYAYTALNNNDMGQEPGAIEKNALNVEEFEDLIAQYTVFAGQIMELSANGDGKAADEMLKSIIPLAEMSLGLLDEMIANSDANIQAVTADINNGTNRSVIFLTVLACILVIFAGALSFFVVASVKKYITHLRNAEHAAGEASRMKSVFLANMSHEIRTPMNGIIGFSELALDDNISPRTKDYLEKIKLSSEGLLQIINDILDVSKVEAGKMELENIPFNIQELFVSCQAIVAPKAMEKGITLFCYAEPSVGKKLLGDPTKLRQSLLNLLSNAVKFTNVGVVKLLSTVSETTDDSVTMHFEVKDSGIGMSPEQIRRVFDPFTQADDATTRKFGGTGLGLPLTQKFVELMGGTLTVESMPGVGSKFSFDVTFKAIDSPSGVADDEIVIDAFKKPSFDGEVLICEDNDMNQQVICDHLARVGLRTTVVSNGKEGVDCVLNRIKRGETPFDLIFMDIHMPVMDGLDAAKKLMEIGNKTPVVALTANIMPTDRKTYNMFGMPDCLAKPFMAQELWICLLKYITPVTLKAIDEKEQSETERKLHNQLLANFLKDHKTTFRDIKGAIEDGDMKYAHRMAHTLKGVAGLIGKTTLQETARTLETLLADENSKVTDVSLQALELELAAVLSEIEQTPGISYPQTASEKALDKENVVELIEKLEPLLKSGDTDCLDMTADLTAIPNSEDLIEQIEFFNFGKALEMLETIKQNI